MKEQPTVNIPLKIYQKLRAYVKGTEYEISGLGKISFFNGIFTIEDIKIFEQTVTAAETTLDRRALGKFYDEILKEEGGLNNWKLWWHSHADMATFFSGTDTSTIEDFDNETEAENWLLSIVTNKKGDIKIRLDLFSPFRMTFDDLEYNIEYENEKIEDEIKDEIEKKVKKQKSLWENLMDDDDEPKYYGHKKHAKKKKKSKLRIIDDSEENKDVKVTVALNGDGEYKGIARRLWEFIVGPPYEQ